MPRERPPLVVLDGAHNPAGARALADALPAILGDVRPVAVIGMMADKDAAGILDALAPLIASAHVTRASSGRAVRVPDAECCLNCGARHCSDPNPRTGR